MSVHQVHCFYFAQIAIIIGKRIASLGKSDLLMEHNELKYDISVEISIKLFSNFRSRFCALKQFMAMPRGLWILNTVPAPINVALD